MSTPERVVRNLHRLLFAHSVALIRHNVRSVVTVEFNVPSVDAELTAAYGWTAIHYDDFVHKTISPTPGQSTPYDIIASFSSLEHTGLGRYGDPLDPQGDITAVGHIHRALKLGGLFVFGAPVGHDALVWNLHRIYGPRRLPMLLAGFRALAWYGDDTLASPRPSPEYYQPFIVLMKVVPLPDPEHEEEAVLHSLLYCART